VRLRRRDGLRELVERQLDLFAEDHAGLLAEAEAADAAWTSAGAEESEELYGDYQLVVDAIGEALYDLREGYAATVDANLASVYRASFDKAAQKRFGRPASFLDD
jgi:hypothetical protein